MKRIIFRAEGSSKIGMGHVMRCLAIQQMLGKNAETAFALFETDEIVKNLISSSQLPIITVPELLDTEYINDFDAVILDGYWFGNDYVKSLKEKDKKLIQIDDLIGKDFFSDMIINHAIGVDYSKSKFLENAVLLTGSKYAMLREEFLQVKKNKRFFEKLISITINMGGADPNNYTLKLLNTISDLPSFHAEINILIGNSYAHKSSITNWINSNQKIKTTLFEGINAGEIISLFKKTSLFICPASTVVYEACAAGVPIACFLTADNQKNIYEGLVNSGAITEMGNLQNMPGHTLKNTLSHTFENYKMFEEKTRFQDQLIDGKSGIRIKEAILALWN